MTPFPAPLRYENSDGESIVLLEPFIYRVSDETAIVVPAGHKCDGQSYPRPLWFIDHPQGKGVKAGVVHDYLYWLNGAPLPETERAYTRRAADEIFRKALIDSGVNSFRAWVRWCGVRVGGWKAWNQHKWRIEDEKAELYRAALSEFAD
jgi:hypothetical protein